MLQRLARKWFAPDGEQVVSNQRFTDVIEGLVVHMTSQAAAILRWLNINRLFKIRQIAVHHEIGLDPIGDAMTTLTQVVDHIEAVARENVLLYLQDILACSLSEMAVFVRHVSRPRSTFIAISLIGTGLCQAHCVPTIARYFFTTSSPYKLSDNDGRRSYTCYRFCGEIYREDTSSNFRRIESEHTPSVSLDGFHEFNTRGRTRL